LVNSELQLPDWSLTHLRSFLRSANRQLAINDWKLRMADLPRLLPFQEATPTRFKAERREYLQTIHQRVLLATFSIRPHLFLNAFPPLRHFDPFGTELL
jgi:hypothetical protein